ncbi:MAG: lipase family protein [Pseudomonadota bacterium]
MPATPLRPEQAARLADMIYGGLVHANTTDTLNAAGGGLGNDFTPISDTLVEGRTGMGSRIRTSNFAMTLTRNGAPREKVVVVRGTDFPSLRDWLTNANVAFVSARRIGGAQVHKGFYAAFESQIDQLNTQLGLRDGDSVHVLGHSLGGAIATLLAAYWAQRGTSTKLYTFGAPRVALPPFQYQTRRRLGAQNIYRVYDFCDPVPMVPIFPFCHPFSAGIAVGRTTGGMNRHSMGNNYIPACTGLSWEQMRRSSNSFDLRGDIDAMLGRARDETRIPGNSFGMWCLGRVLYLLVVSIGGALTVPAIATLTVIDRIAMILETAASAIRGMADRVMSWLRSALRWLGREVAAPAADVTRSFLRYVLDLFFRGVSAAASRMIDMVH